MDWDMQISVLAAILAAILEIYISKLLPLYGDRFPKLEVIEIDSSFVFVAEL